MASGVYVLGLRMAKLTPFHKIKDHYYVWVASCTISIYESPRHGSSGPGFVWLVGGKNKCGCLQLHKLIVTSLLVALTHSLQAREVGKLDAGEEVAGIYVEAESSLWVRHPNGWCCMQTDGNAAPVRD